VKCSPAVNKAPILKCLCNQTFGGEAAVDKDIVFPFDKKKTPLGNRRFCGALEWGMLRAQNKKGSYGND